MAIQGTTQTSSLSRAKYGAYKRKRATAPEARLFWTRPFLLSLLGLFAPTAYLFGDSYYRGKLITFGIPPEAFPISTTNTYITAYEVAGDVMLSIAIDGMRWAESLFQPPRIYLAVGTILLGLVCYVVIAKLKHWATPRLTKLGKRIAISARTADWLFLFAKSWFAVFLVVYIPLLCIYAFGALSFLWWAPSLPYLKGVSDAKKEMEEIAHQGCAAQWNPCVFITDKKGTILHEGLLVAINEKEIALLKVDGGYVIKRDDEQILKHRVELPAVTISPSP